MNYQDAIEKLERMRSLMGKEQLDGKDRDELSELYGSLDETMNRFGGIEQTELTSCGLHDQTAWEDVGRS